MRALLSSIGSRGDVHTDCGFPGDGARSHAPTGRRIAREIDRDEGTAQWGTCRGRACEGRWTGAESQLDPVGHTRPTRAPVAAAHGVISMRPIQKNPSPKQSGPSHVAFSCTM
jgi:hypothetical protein